MGCGTGWDAAPPSPPHTPMCCCGAMGGSCGRAMGTPSPMSSTGGTCPSPRWGGPAWVVGVMVVEGWEHHGCDGGWVMVMLVVVGG